jgi:hypothetical protein
MDVCQISIFLENRSGGLADVVDVLARNGVDMKAASVADMADFGILRVIVDDAERTRGVLKAAGFTVDKTDVVAVEVPDRPGGLADTLRVLRAGGINVEYMYSAARKNGERAIIIFRFDDVPRALETLRGAGIMVLERLDDLPS